MFYRGTCTWAGRTRRRASWRDWISSMVNTSAFRCWGSSHTWSNAWVWWCAWRQWTSATSAATGTALSFSSIYLVHKVGDCESEPEKDNPEELETVIIQNTKEGKQSRIVTVDASFKPPWKQGVQDMNTTVKKNQRRIKEKRQQRLLKFQEKLVMSSGLPPRFIERMERKGNLHQETFQVQWSQLFPFQQYMLLLYITKQLPIQFHLYWNDNVNLSLFVMEVLAISWTQPCCLHLHPLTLSNEASTRT